MNDHINYYLAQSHTDDLIRDAEHQRLARTRARRRPRPRTAIRRILDRVLRAGTTSVPTASPHRGSC
jgi:hypothetical protein